MRVRTCTSPIKLKRLKVHAVGLCEQNVVTLALTFHGYKDNGEGQTTAFRVPISLLIAPLNFRCR